MSFEDRQLSEALMELLALRDLIRSQQSTIEYLQSRIRSLEVILEPRPSPPPETL